MIWKRTAKCERDQSLLGLHRLGPFAALFQRGGKQKPPSANFFLRRSLPNLLYPILSGSESPLSRFGETLSPPMSQRYTIEIDCYS